MTKVRVISEFRDKFQFSKLYKVGSEVEGFDETRIADLSARGLVEVIGEQKPISDIDLNASVAAITEEITKMEDVNALNEVLTAEKKGKNRSGTIKAIEARIADLTSNEQ